MKLEPYVSWTCRLLLGMGVASENGVGTDIQSDKSTTLQYVKGRRVYGAMYRSYFHRSHNKTFSQQTVFQKHAAYVTSGRYRNNESVEIQKQEILKTAARAIKYPLVAERLPSPRPNI